MKIVESGFCRDYAALDGNSDEAVGSLLDPVEFMLEQMEIGRDCFKALFSLSSSATDGSR